MPLRGASIGLLAVLYAAVMVAAALWMPHEWDWRVFRLLSSRVAPTFAQQVSIVDVQRDPADIPSFRRRIASFLDGLVKNNRRPRAVIVDVEFDPCQSRECGEPMQSARLALVTSIRAATRFFPVYATEEFGVDRGDNVSGPLDPQDARIYSALSGAAQTRFTSVPSAQGLFYRVCYSGVPFGNASGDILGTQDVWAMVVRVLMPPRSFGNSLSCNPAHIPVRMGERIPQSAPFVYRFTDPRSFSQFSDFDDGTFIIVGTIEGDRSPFVDRSGPELLGWALSNALDQGSLVGEAPYYDAAPQNTMLLLLVPAFSALAVLAFVAIFFQLRRVKLQRVRYLLPFIAATGAALVGLVTFAIFETSLFLSHHIQPQVSLISLGIVVAAGLSGLRGSQLLFEDESTIEPAPVETYDYDVFISYAHQDGAWVYENVYVPFRDAVLPNGKKLSIFFDTSSIRAGTGWQVKLALAIDASRFIVPVYSDRYFRQPYCRFEIMRAHRKWVLAGEESRCVLPIMRGHPNIYAAVDDIQALSVDDHPGLISQVLDEIVEIMGKQTTPTEHRSGVTS
jgi:hypothetical protein